MMFFFQSEIDDRVVAAIEETVRPWRGRIWPGALHFREATAVVRDIDINGRSVARALAAFIAAGHEGQQIRRLAAGGVHVDLTGGVAAKKAVFRGPVLAVPIPRTRPRMAGWIG